jgi:hypothetical protein
MLPPVPAAVVLMATVLPAPLSVTARRKSTASEVVLTVREPVIVTAPAPFCVTAPVVVISAAETAAIASYGMALLEIQAARDIKETWFVPLNIVQGQIA